MKPTYMPEYVSAQIFKMEDENGDRLALYKNEYFKLDNNTYENLQDDKLTVTGKTQLCNAKGIQLVKYFSQENLSKFQIYNIENIGEINGIKPNKHQNCLTVSQDWKVYLHPKIRAHITNIGVNHSSLSGGRRVKFAGSLVEENGNWFLENTTGHYGTRPSKIINCIQAFKQNHISIKNLIIRQYIVVDKNWLDNHVNEKNKIFIESDFTYLIEEIAAEELAKRCNLDLGVEI